MTERTRLFILFSAAALLGYLELKLVDIPGIGLALIDQQRIITHAIEAPYRERILTYATAQLIGSHFVVPGIGIWTMLVLINLACMVGFLYASYRFLCHFGSRDSALVLTLFIALTFNVTVQFTPRPFPDSSLNALLFAVALNLLYRIFGPRPTSVRRQLLIFGVLIAIGASNRIDTLTLLGAFAALAWYVNRRLLIYVPVFLAAGLAVFFAVQSVTGAGERLLSIVDILALNWLTFGDAMISLLVVFSGLWWLMLQRFRHAPGFLRWALIGLLPYAALLIVYGLWRETRLLVPFMPLLMAVILSNEPSRAKTST